jgi:hypothetical protein
LLGLKVNELLQSFWVRLRHRGLAGSVNAMVGWALNSFSRGIEIDLQRRGLAPVSCR